MNTNALDATPAGAEPKPRRNLTHRLLSGAAWAFAGKVVGVTSMLVVNAILARMLPPEEMGAYFLLTSIVMFAAIVARFGLQQTVVRLVAESMAKDQPGRAGATLRIVYVIVALGALTIGGAYYLGLGAWLAEDVFAIPVLATVTGLTALWIAVLAFQTPVAETFRGLHDIRLAVFLDGVFASALLAATLGAYWITGLKVTFALIRLTERCAEMGIGVYFYSSTDAVLERLIANFKAAHPDLVIAGAESPPFRLLSRDEDEATVRASMVVDPVLCSWAWVARNKSSG